MGLGLGIFYCVYFVKDDGYCWRIYKAPPPQPGSAVFFDHWCVFGKEIYIFYRTEIEDMIVWIAREGFRGYRSLLCGKMEGGN